MIEITFYLPNMHPVNDSLNLYQIGDTFNFNICKKCSFNISTDELLRHIECKRKYMGVFSYDDKTNLVYCNLGLENERRDK